MIIKYGSGKTALTKISIISPITHSLNSIPFVHFSVIDTEATLYSTWKDNQDEIIYIMNNDGDTYYFIGRVKSMEFENDRLNISCEGDTARMNDKPYDKNYIYAQGKIKTTPPYDGSDDKLELCENNDDEDAFTWDNDEWIDGKDNAILTTDATDFVSKDWKATANDQSSWSDSEDDYPNTWTLDGVVHALADRQQDGFDAYAIYTVSGDAIATGNYLKNIQIEFKIGAHGLYTGYPNSPYFCTCFLEIQNIDTSGWVQIGRVNCYSDFNNWHYSSLVTWILDGTNTELEDYLTEDGGNYTDVQIRLRMVGSPSGSGTSPISIACDYLKVTINYESADFSPMMKQITDNGASWIESTGADFTANYVQADDLFLIGENTKSILTDALNFAGIPFDIDSNFSKYIARHFKGVDPEQITTSICELEDAYFFEKYVEDEAVLGVMKASSFEDVDSGSKGHTDTAITSADYGYDFKIERSSNQIKRFTVWGNNYWSISYTAYDHTAANTSDREGWLVDDTIATQADARDVAESMLDRLKVVRPSIKISLSGEDYNHIFPGMIVYATFERPTIAKTAYEVRRVTRSQGSDGINGLVKTEVWLGLGETPIEEHIGRTIRKAVLKAQKAHTDKLIPSSSGGVPRVSHTALTNITSDDHHERYTDAEAAAKILADDLYAKVAGDTFTDDVTISKAAGDSKLTILNSNDDAWLVLDAADDAQVRFQEATVYQGDISHNAGENAIVYSVITGDSHIFKINSVEKGKLDTNDLQTQTNIKIRDGHSLFISSAGNDKWAELKHDDTNFYIQNSSGDIIWTIGTEKMRLDTDNLDTQTHIRTRGGHNLYVYEAANTKHININHDGTNGHLIVGGGAGNFYIWDRTYFRVGTAGAWIDVDVGNVKAKNGHAIYVYSTGDDKHGYFYHNDTNLVIYSSSGQLRTMSAEVHFRNEANNDYTDIYANSYNDASVPLPDDPENWKELLPEFLKTNKTIDIIEKYDEEVEEEIEEEDPETKELIKRKVMVTKHKTRKVGEEEVVGINIGMTARLALRENAELKTKFNTLNKRYNDREEEFEQYITLIEGLMKEVVALRGRAKTLEGIEGIEYKEDESSCFINK